MDAPRPESRFDKLCGLSATRSVGIQVPTPERGNQLQLNIVSPRQRLECARRVSTRIRSPVVGVTVMQCLENQLLESPKWPLAFSENLIETLDNVRGLIGLEY